ncbi:hypothetical protein GCM10028773_36640 [Spirosoma koreense]
MLIGCQPDPVTPDKDVAALYERFHGKYKPTQAVVSEAVDINLDGKASFELLSEMPALATADLQINIIAKNDHVPTDEFLFTQFWPEQYLSQGGRVLDGPVAYEPTITVNYAEQPVTRRCSFNRQLTEIKLEPAQNQSVDPIRWVQPESVDIRGKQQIQVVSQRQLYTRAGWRTVTITILYERYQQTT